MIAYRLVDEQVNVYSKTAIQWQKAGKPGLLRFLTV